MYLSVLTHVIIYISIILLLSYIKKYFPNNSIITFFKRYGGLLIVIVFIYVLLQLRVPITTVGVLIIGFILVFGYLIFKSKQ